MIIQGKVTSGLGVAKKWIKKMEKSFYKKTGELLFAGTLNIRLDSEYNFNPDMIIDKDEYGGNFDVHIKKCELLNETAYIVRSAKNINRDGDYKPNIVEIMAETNFREKYNLKDDDIITISI